MFQFFPLRNQIIPIDSKTLIELFVKENKNEYLCNIDKYKHELLSYYFNINDKIFKQNNYVFDYRISTDCYAVSIQLLNNNNVEKEQTKKQNMKNKKSEIKDKCKDMEQKDKEKYKKNLENKKKEEEQNRKLEIKKIMIKKRRI